MLYVQRNMYMYVCVCVYIYIYIYIYIYTIHTYIHTQTHTWFSWTCTNRDFDSAAQTYVHNLFALHEPYTKPPIANSEASDDEMNQAHSHTHMFHTVGNRVKAPTAWTRMKAKPVKTSGREPVSTPFSQICLMKVLEKQYLVRMHVRWRCYYLMLIAWYIYISMLCMYIYIYIYIYIHTHTVGDTQ